MTFDEYLRKKARLPEKKRPYYLQWITLYQKYLLTESENPTILGFQKSLLNSYQDWQIDQAVEAVKHFNFYRQRYEATDCRKNDLKPDSEISISTQWMHSRQTMKEMLRHRSYQTEKSYLRWLDSFGKFLQNRKPDSLDESDLRSFLTHLAVEKRISVSTQNQAFNALLFFYRNVLERDIQNMEDTIRSKVPSRLPVVMTIEEIKRVVDQLNQPHRLMASLIYGGGLRLNECLSLRVKDLDIDKNSIHIHEGKGNKDRITLLPATLVPVLQDHLRSVRNLFDTDRKTRQPGVALSESLERKYPNAPMEWGWYWIFPSPGFSENPYTGEMRRYHIHPSALQRAFHTAVKLSGITKKAFISINSFDCSLL